MEIFFSDYSVSVVGELPFTAKEMLWAEPGDRREQDHLLNLIVPRGDLGKGLSESNGVQRVAPDSGTYVEHEKSSCKLQLSWKLLSLGVF